jgi:hypothetical protein
MSKDIYRAFADTLETKVRVEADSRESTKESYAYMFGYTLGTIPHLLENLNLTEDQLAVLDQYWVNYP